MGAQDDLLLLLLNTGTYYAAVDISFIHGILCSSLKHKLSFLLLFDCLCSGCYSHVHTCVHAPVYSSFGCAELVSFILILQTKNT